MVEWIEITFSKNRIKYKSVSTLVVEWIEINRCTGMLQVWLVSTLVVEWIEIAITKIEPIPPFGLHPRGGVD